MKIENIKELEELLDLCQKKNVHTIVVGDLTVQLTPTVVQPQRLAEPEKEVYIDPATGMPMSDEELMFYASMNADAGSK